MRAMYPKPIVNQFNEINIGKYLGTRHFEIDYLKNVPNILSPKIRIAVNRSFAKSLPKYWLSFRPHKKWISTTGLFQTATPKYYKGDAEKKRHLIICRVDEYNNTVILFYFSNYFTSDAITIKSIIDDLKSIYN
jgi:hypothetical protein